MKAQRLTIAFALALGALTFAAYWYGHIPPVMRPALAPAWNTPPEEHPPVTAVMVRSINGAPPSAEFLFAVRADGATAMVDSTETPRRVISLPGGWNATIVPPLRLISSVYRETGHRGTPESNCATSPATVLGEEPQLGYRAIRIAVENSESLRVTSWKIPALGCFEAKRRTEHRQQDGTITSTEERALIITPGEPDPEHFRIPAGFQEVSPSVMEQRVAAHRGNPCPGCDTRAGSKDHDYNPPQRTPGL